MICEYTAEPISVGKLHLNLPQKHYYFSKFQLFLFSMLIKEHLKHLEPSFFSTHSTLTFKVLYMPCGTIKSFVRVRISQPLFYTYLWFHDYLNLFMAMRIKYFFCSGFLGNQNRWTTRQRMEF